jgi:CspA family cold shock protein
MNNQKNKVLPYDPKTTYTGNVLWFSDQRGYGFIETDELKIDGKSASIFAHFSRINSGENYKTLSKQQKVSFEIAESEKGLMAVNIREFKVIKTNSTVINQLT